ncbi:UNVERIFIED_CONTAM: Solanesyl diphosphate synthase 2, chloroplastic [Sesamum radiatum]|uniref:Solanesyl diphosphate synthase 2, chloroplastic n=1 Tax=Sesamum radiatum TaxID=300843 RepID=A0AAW2LNF5_SESRA
MMSVSCHNLEFGRTRMEFAACGCSSNASPNRLSVRNRAKGLLRNVNSGCKARKLLCSRREIGRCRVFSTKTPEAFLSGVAAGPPPVLDLTKEPTGPSSLADMFEVVAEDLLTLNKNLQSIVGSENPVLMSAASKSGGKENETCVSSFKSHCGDCWFEERKRPPVIRYKSSCSGDFMFAQSSWYLANLENLEVIKLISQYLIKSYYKTASLIAASTKGAAIFSGVNSEISEQMYQYGKNLGLSFQVVDDILDFTQSAEQLGKPAGSDLAKGNLTAPVIFALEKETKLRDIIESEFCETGSLEEAIDIVKNCGGIERARELAREMAHQAIQNLHCLPQSSFRRALEQMVYYNLERIK